MAGADRSQPVKVMVSRRLGVMVLAGFGAFGIATALWLWRPSSFRALFGGIGTSVPRPLGSGSPYRNAHPDVAYVGDAACERCHADLVQAFRAHPMGRSLSPVNLVSIPGIGSPSFQAQGLEYSVERRGARVVHKEIKRGPAGEIVSQNEAEARYAIGSGAQAIAFLVERGDGHLFESPITWYSQKEKWDLSPGYRQDNLHFERFIKPACLFCHSNRFDHVAGTENRYNPPIFLGHAIGCERCHGPGELHVKRPERSSDEPATIVNPARLPPVLREAVCQQCHLQGDIRIVRAGRKLTDYRPGLPLSSVESVFVKADNVGKSRFFGQVEQMTESRCFRASGGKMGCISCHDPHELPVSSEKAAYYRDRCLNCHAEKGCTLPKPEQLARVRDGSCVDCHMPRSANEQVPHTATTLHLISRFPERARAGNVPGRSSSATDVPLIHFHHDQIGPDERAGVARDLGIALATNGRSIPGWSAPAVSRLALPLLETAIHGDRGDGPAWEARGTALWLLGRREESLSSFRTALATSPHREETLVAAGTRAAQLGKREEALTDFQQAIAIDPFRADYHQVVALIHSQRQEWNPAIEAAHASLRLNPSNHEVRMILIQCLLKTQRLAEAGREFQALLDHDPPGREALQAWFQKSQGP